MKRSITFLSLSLLLFAVAAFAAEPLRVSAIPDEAPTELQRKFEPLGRYLSQHLHREVLFVPVTDYAAVVEALAAKKIDLAWLGGFTFVQARQRTGTARPIVQRAEDAVFTSKIIVNANSGIKNLADLKGKSFAFGSPSSTSGHLMPRYYLTKQGINVDADLVPLAYSGAHDATVAWVASGKVQAGALNASVWEKLLEQKKVDPKRVEVLWTTPPFYDYNWTVRGDLDAAIVSQLIAAFLALDPANPVHADILKLQRASRYIATDVQHYAGIEAAAREAKLLP